MYMILFDDLCIDFIRDLFHSVTGTSTSPFSHEDCRSATVGDVSSTNVPFYSLSSGNFVRETQYNAPHDQGCS